MSDLALASRLAGKKVGKWYVREKRIKEGADDSGAFSSGYKVEDENGKIAFMKSFNYFYAFRNLGPSADALKTMVDSYTYERDLLAFCADYNMRRVVTAIDSGEYREPEETVPVPYLVFELAEGNLPKYQEMKNPKLAWKLVSFHGTLVGLSQLHRANIAHQDLKPSNILIFGNEISKIGDLGCATQLDNESGWDTGDLRYSPIELHYKYHSLDWETRRFGADFFMMGGLLTYLMTGSNFLSLLVSKIPEDFRPFKFGGTFDQVKTYLIKAYYETLSEVEESINPSVRDDLIGVIKELVHPIPEKRGNPQNLSISRHRPFSLEKYISILDRISKKALWGKL